MKSFVYRFALVAAFLVFLQACGGEDAAPFKQPSIVLITAGDIAFEDLGTYGGPIPTPNLDRLAATGTVFTNAYAAAAQPGPARAALASGRYPQRFGYQFDTGGVRKTITERSGMPDSVVLLPELLQALGYRTAMFGSWHLGAAPNFYPMFRGFDSFWGTLGASTAYTQPRKDSAVFVQTDNYRLPPSRSRFNTVFAGRQAETVNNTGLYLTDDMGDQVVAEIDDKMAPQPADTAAVEVNPPLFLWASFHAPREPLTALKSDIASLEDFSGSAARKAYAGMIVALDRNVGKILDALEAQGQLDQTLVIFTADRGCDAAVNTCPCKSLRGGAPSFREGGLRVPLIMSLPSQFAGGNIVSASVMAIDITPTVIALANSKPRFMTDVDGVDLRNALQGDASRLRGRTIFFEQYPLAAAIYGNNKLLLDGQSNSAKLYNLAQDPGEATDLASGDVYTVSELETKLDVWRQSNTYPLWEGYNTETMRICGADEQVLR